MSKKKPTTLLTPDVLERAQQRESEIEAGRGEQAPKQLREMIEEQREKRNQGKHQR